MRCHQILMGVALVAITSSCTGGAIEFMSGVQKQEPPSLAIETSDYAPQECAAPPLAMLEAPPAAAVPAVPLTPLAYLPTPCTIVADFRPNEAEATLTQQFVPQGLATGIHGLLDHIPLLLRHETTEVAACIHLRSNPTDLSVPIPISRLTATSIPEASPASPSSSTETLDVAYLVLAAAAPFSPAALNEALNALSKETAGMEQTEQELNGVHVTLFSDGRTDWAWIPAQADLVVLIHGRHAAVEPLMILPIAPANALAADANFLKRWKLLPAYTLRALLSAPSGIFPANVETRVQRLRDALGLTATTPVGVGVALNLHETVGGFVQLMLDGGSVPDLQVSAEVATQLLATGGDKLFAYMKGLFHHASGAPANDAADGETGVTSPVIEQGLQLFRK